VRHAVDGISAITNDLREVSDSIRVMGGGVRHVSENVKRITDDLESITSSTAGRISGIRAGVEVALSIIRKGLWK